MTTISMPQNPTMMRPMTWMTYLVPIFALAASALAPANAAASQRADDCRELAASIQAGQKAVRALREARDAAREAAEAAGETWENAEAVRNFGETSASEADDARETWETRKAAFHDAQAELIARSESVNAAIATYNERCASRKPASR